jgi:hypothetical protein
VPFIQQKNSYFYIKSEPYVTNFLAFYLYFSDSLYYGYDLSVHAVLLYRDFTVIIVNFFIYFDICPARSMYFV